MWLTSWLLQLRSTAHHRPGGPTRPKPRFRPQLEALDERWLPSTLTVTNNLGFGAGSLRAEIGIAQSGDTIVFDQSLRGQTIAIDTNAPFEPIFRYKPDGVSHELFIPQSYS